MWSFNFANGKHANHDEPEADPPAPLSSARKRLYVAVVGLPNAGKSQLLNAMTLSRVSAVFPKRHTTRVGLLGARTIDNTQLVFIDTPGFLRDLAKGESLDRDLMTSASSHMIGVDHTLLVVDAARRMTEDVQSTLVQLMLLALQAQGRVEAEESDQDQPAVANKLSIVLNKVDLVHPKVELLDTAEEIGALAEECLQYREPGDTTPLYNDRELDERQPIFFYASAAKNQGVEDVLDYLLSMATPSHEWPVEAGQATDLAPTDRVEEVVREKLYRCLHQEVPYQIRQRNLLFEVRKDSNGQTGLLVHQELIVGTKSHRDMVGGSTLERIRTMAEKDLVAVFGCRVILQLFVKQSKRKRRWSVD